MFFKILNYSFPSKYVFLVKVPKNRLSNMSRSFSNHSDDADRDGWFFMQCMIGNNYLANYIILLHAT